MDMRALFGLSAGLGLFAAGLLASIQIWPWLRAMPRDRALGILAVPQAFRFVGLSFLVDGVVSPSLPEGFAAPAAYGDLITAILAITAMPALDRRWSWATIVVWLMNAWGTADLLFATYRGALVGLRPEMLGAAFFIPTAFVPLLLAAHVLSFRLLLSAAGERFWRRESHAV
jgi:hypothetical protein